MGATDQMLARYMAEIEERQTFVDGIFTAADGNDLTDEEMELVTDTSNRMTELNKKIEPLMEMRRISGDSAEPDRRAREVHAATRRRRRRTSSTAPPAST